MFRISHPVSLLFTGTILLGGIILCPSQLHAQETVKINTVDGVRLNAVYYRGKNKSIATVIMLHPIGQGESIKKDGWKNLAETLQMNDFSVLMFDFRGHGESTTIDEPEKFWAYLPNQKFVRAANKERDTIDYKDFSPHAAQYDPVLINDIAAVKAYLDRKHDAGDCNTSNTIVIGAETGATLGAIWINSEWNRYRLVPDSTTGQAQLSKRAEGHDIVAAVWLNIQPDLGKRKVPLTAVLYNACRLRGMATAFFYGEEDTKANDYTKVLVDRLKDKKSKKHEYIGPVKMPKTKLSGVKLLVKGLKTNEVIAEYLDNVLKDRSNERESRSASDAIYWWRDPRTNQPTVCKPKLDKLFKYDTYEKFISQ